MTECRKECGACCIAPSISSPVPGMPEGKPAGIRCAQLGADHACRLYGRTGRPGVCASYQASEEFCGADRREALHLLAELERMTAQEMPRKGDEGP